MKTKRKTADISIMVAIFCAAFLAFCAFAIDMTYVTINRAKLQRACETTALASVAKYKSTYENDTENLFKFFKLGDNALKNANVESAEFKGEDDGSQKLKLTVQLPQPTYFLRFAGVGTIKIRAVSYAKAYTQTISSEPSGEAIELSDIMTDKNGTDFSVSTNAQGFFVFAGIKDDSANIIWQDAGCKADVSAQKINIDGSEFNLICADNANFDLSKPCENDTQLNVVKYLKVYRANKGDCPTMGTGADQADDFSYEIKITNNVKLITKNDF